jgi:hypothetical protein
MVAVVLALPASAGAVSTAYQRVLAVYQRNGTIPACRFSSGVLEAALRGVDTYGAQYFADFTQAINNALASRASGQCSRRAGPAVASTGPPIGGSGPGVGFPAHLGSVSAATASGMPAPLLILLILTSLGLFAGGAALVRRWTHELSSPGGEPDANGAAVGHLAGGGGPGQT